MLVGAGLGAEAHESRAQHALQVRVRLIAYQVADFADGQRHQFSAARREQVRELAYAGRDPAPRFAVLGIQAVQIIFQNGDCAFLVAAFQQYLDKLANVAGRHTSRFVRQQYALLARFRYFCPEHPVQDVGMRLHQNAGLAHLVFLQLQNLAQGVHLPAHVLHHLVHGIDLHFAFLESFQSEAYGHMLGRLHQ